jgi:monoamine oxidase
MENIGETESPMIRRAAGKIPHICVVGAGVAGLRCAAVLLKHAVKVTILEGRHRVGGRVRCLLLMKKRRVAYNRSFAKVMHLVI